MGDFARRRSIPASLWYAAFGSRAVGKTAASRQRPTARLSGARAVIGLLESLARPLLRMLDPEDAHRVAVQALKFPPFVKLAADDPRLAVRAFGINICANKESPDRIADYVRLIETFAPVVSYFSVNISSPNTPGLRELQQGKMLDNLLERVMDARARMSREAGTTPVLIKIAPDLTLSELDDIVGAARRHRVDGMIIGNTTVTRPPTLREVSTAREAGGLSGRPLFSLATRMLAESYVRVEGAFPLIGVGGIDSGEAAIEKIRAGACLIQLYSALVFHGLRIVQAIKSELSNALRRENQPTIDELVGTDAAAMTAEPWPR